MLKNKTILIMGIRNKWSIAYGVAEALKKQGANLIFTFQNEENREKIEELVVGYKCYVLNDAANDEEVENVFSKIKIDNGKLDGIIHLVAHANTEDLHKGLSTISKDGFLHALEVSTYSLTLALKKAQELELLKEYSSIVTLTYFGSEKVIPGYNIMGVAKAALEASTRYLASENSKIRVNAVSAGPIKTLSAKGIKDFSKMLEIVKEKSPLKKNVTQEEIGNVVAFLSSDMSKCITGQVIFADNGYNIMGI